jgi:hypothetical protein
MIAKLIARIGALGVALIVVAALLVGGLGGGLVEHFRLAADQQQQGQNGEQTGNQGGSDGEGGSQGASQEDQTGNQGQSQEGNDTTDSNQHGQQT